MKLLSALLQEAKKNEMDPSQVTARDVTTYVNHVNRALKGKKMSKGAISSAVHEIAEDDPKFGANPGSVSKLVAAVAAKLLAAPVAKPVAESVEAAAVAGLALKLTAGEITYDEFRSMLDSADAATQSADPAAPGADVDCPPDADCTPNAAPADSADPFADDENDPFADDERKFHESAQLSPRATVALRNKLAEAATVASKEVVEEASRIDVDELTTTEISAKLLAAAKAGHPGVSGMKVHADDKMMRVEVPGTDRCYATLSLTTGVINVLKEGWDAEEEEEQEEKTDKKSKLSPRAEKAVEKKKDDKKVAEAVEAAAEVVAESAPPAEPKKIGRFMQAILDGKKAE